MRKKLSDYFNQDIRVKGVVVRRCKKHSRSRGTVGTYCLKPVTSTDGELLADHIWVTQSNDLRRSEAKVGDTIEFDAKVIQYLRGYQAFRHGQSADVMTSDYGLGKVRNVEVIANA